MPRSFTGSHVSFIFCGIKNIDHHHYQKLLCATCFFALYLYSPKGNIYHLYFMILHTESNTIAIKQYQGEFVLIGFLQ